MNFFFLLNLSKIIKKHNHCYFFQLKKRVKGLLLCRETEDRELLKDPSMLKRLNDIAKFPEQDKACILYVLDAMINNVKLKAI
ncbi:MAG: hypothetical protein CFE24_07145 [Flavobacterium sp. BFFFF2]|nr:MAG: hypothetical protein CFE24_07145 [Flavobacterium sp. BFFFF2]